MMDHSFACCPSRLFLSERLTLLGRAVHGVRLPAERLLANAAAKRDRQPCCVSMSYRSADEQGKAISASEPEQAAEVMQLAFKLPA